MFLGLQDPDPLARGMDTDPSLSHKGVDLTEIKEILTQNFGKKLNF
jgi:hypothetical protein